MSDKKCKYTLDDGTQCGSWALKEKEFCFSHDPDSREAKLLAVRKGGLAKEITIETPLMPIAVATPKDVVMLLAQTINKINLCNGRKKKNFSAVFFITIDKYKP